MRRTRFFWLYTLPLLGYLALIAILSHRPGGGQPWYPHMDKVAHLIEYAPVGFLALRWYFGRNPRRPIRRTVAVLGAAAFGALYGTLDEIHQSFVPGRQMDVFDAVADACGSALGGAIYVLLVRPQPR